MKIKAIEKYINFVYDTGKLKNMSLVDFRIIEESFTQLKNNEKIITFNKNVADFFKNNGCKVNLKTINYEITK